MGDQATPKDRDVRAAETLIKYATVDTARLILENRTLRWSSPELFPDPWELRADPPLPFDHLAINQAMLKTATAMIFTRDLPAGNLQHPLYKAIRRWRAEDRFHDEEEAYSALSELLSATANTLQVKLQKLSCAWHAMVSRARVLSFSDTVKDVNSWRRYADDYRGVALKFDNRDGGLLADAKPVEYTNTRPTLTTVKEQVEDLVGIKRAECFDTLRDKLTMKPKMDAGEREWRCIQFEEDDDFSPGDDPVAWYIDHPWEAEDLRGIYFGCNISPADQQQLMDLANEKYQPVVFYRAQLSPETFDLEFERI